MPCINNVLPAGTVRLPRNKSEGDIPLTAVATGNVDKLQCLLRKIGIEDAEFTNPDGNGRIRFYRSNGSSITPTQRPPINSKARPRAAANGRSTLR
jgi:hypothetical protein